MTSTSSPFIVAASQITTLAGADVEAMAVLGDRVAAVGTLRDLRDQFAAAEVVALPDAHIVPGFNDAHCHPSVTSETRLRLDVSPATVTTVEDLLSRLKDRADSVADGEWIFAAGFNPNRLPRNEPRIDRDMLDRISTTKPIAVVLFNWHIAVVNTAALRLLEVDDHTLDPVGGEYGRDSAGRLDGWLIEQAFLNPYWAATGQTPWVADLPQDMLVDALVEENNFLHSVGITSYCDAIVTPRIWRTYEAARARGQLTPRVGMLLWSTYFESIAQLGLRSGFGDEHLRFVGVKVMYDGALSGGTCLCTQAYASGTGSDNGLQLVDRGEFNQLVSDVHESGNRICVHANGDRAISEVLDAIELARSRDPRNGINHRIEHCSMVDATLLERIKRSGTTPVPFSGAIRQHASHMVEYYGRERTAQILPHKAFLDSGITVGGSSDYPTTPVEPLTALQSLLTRASATDGTVHGADQRLSIREALSIYTIGSAVATGEQHLKGQLKPGMLADFTVLDTNIVENPDSVSSASVVQTWVGGTNVWSARGHGLSR
jgi:predicted amidohydrolase YtcJ